MYTQITFDKYQIRSYRKSDKDSLLKYANNHNISKYLRDSFPHPYTEADAEKWINSAINQDQELNFAIATEEEIIGGIGIIRQPDIYRFSAEIGYWLAEPFWRKGIATNAVKLMTAYVFDNFEFNRLFAGVFEGNESSEKVLRKAGFKLEAKLHKAVFKEGKLLNQLIYALLKEDFNLQKESAHE